MLKRSLAYLAGLGVVVNVGWSIGAWLGVLSGRGPTGPIVGGGFVLTVAAIFQLNHVGYDSRNPWKYAFLGAPRWMVWLWRASWVYAFASFAAAALVKDTSDFGRFGAPIMLVFYATAMGVLYGGAQLDELRFEWRCERGHRAPPGARHCEECGAEVPDLETVLQSRSGAG